MNKTYTFGSDSINIKNSFTWENSSESWENSYASKNFGKWTLISNGTPNEYPPLPSEGELMNYSPAKDGWVSRFNAECPSGRP